MGKSWYHPSLSMCHRLSHLHYTLSLLSAPYLLLIPLSLTSLSFLFPSFSLSPTHPPHPTISVTTHPLHSPVSFVPHASQKDEPKPDAKYSNKTSSLNADSATGRRWKTFSMALTRTRSTPPRAQTITATPCSPRLANSATRRS